MVEEKLRFNNDLIILGILCGIKLLIHLLTNQTYGFHRDEYLYMDYGRHLSSGYYDVPPLTALLARFAELLPGNSLFALRLLPALTGMSTLFIAGLLVIEMGGKRFALILASLALIFTSLLRVDTLFQPVSFDVFFWTLCSYLLISYLKDGKGERLIWLGLAFGLGILNKYTILLWGFGALTGLILFRRETFREARLYLGVLMALLLALPNLIWQLAHHLPALAHLGALSRSQFIHVSYAEIVISQFLFFGPGFILWILGLIAVTNSKIYRPVAVIYFMTIIVLLLFKGKSYYSLGIYPVLIGLGAVYMENLKSVIFTTFLRPLIVAAVIIAGVILLPAMAPVLPAPYLIRYCSWVNSRLGVEFRRWEDGKVHALPQDFSDMYGWEEGAQKTLYWYNSIPENERSDYILCASDYGLASSVDYYGKNQNLPDVYNDSSGMIDWVPITVTAHRVLYIGNSVGKDLANFRHVAIVDSITDPYSREKGTYIAIATDCRPDLPALWKSIYLVKKSAGPFRE